MGSNANWKRLWVLAGTMRRLLAQRCQGAKQTGEFEPPNKRNPRKKIFNHGFHGLARILNCEAGNREQAQVFNHEIWAKVLNHGPAFALLPPSLRFGATSRRGKLDRMNKMNRMNALRGEGGGWPHSFALATVSWGDKL
jgi:hypothetical protein